MTDESQHASIGRWMIIAGWIVFLLLLTMLFGDYLEQQHNPNQVPVTAENVSSRSVTLQQNRFGHYVASGAINGQSVTFFLDTGATSVSVPESVAKELNLQRGLVNSVNTANGTITVYATRLDSVQLGNIELRNIQAHINPQMGGREILLGMSFLKQLAFSQQGDKLTITQTITTTP